MEETQENLYQKIIQIYHETESVKETAKKLGTYPIKVRRVLITEGLWHSNTSIQIVSLYASGLSVAEIAKQLFISEKNVQSYLPYSRGQYGGDNRSGEAVRSEGYRERMQVAESSQVKKKNQNINPDKEMEKNSMQKLDVIKERDDRKNKLCEEHGIKLLFYSNLDIKYPYKVFENKEELLHEIIK